MPDLQQTIKKIQPVSAEELRQAQTHLDQLTKPPGSLGRLEDLACRYAAIKGLNSPKIEQKTIFVFAADHGVVDEGISAYPAAVTPQMVLNFLNGGAAINVLARHVNAEVVIVDMGVNHDFESGKELVDKKIAHGTRNMAKGPCMTRQQAETALQTGLNLADEWRQKGVDVFGTGDMGIGNTTSSAAIMALYANQPVEQIAGRGTGIDDRILQKKIAIIKESLRINQPDPADPIDVLSKIGGFEIGGMAGLILGAASNRTPVVVDGLISGAAAVLAIKLNDSVRDFIFPSHLSCEPGHKVFFDILDQRPLFDLDMRLGEGTGAALGMSLLEAGVKVYSEMATFQSAGVSGKTQSQG